MMSKKIYCLVLSLGLLGFCSPLFAMKQELSAKPIDVAIALDTIKKIAESWLVTAQRLVREYCKMKNYKELSGDFSEDKDIRKQKIHYLDEWSQNIIQEKKNEIFFFIQQESHALIKILPSHLKEKFKELLNIEKILLCEESITGPKELLTAVQTHCFLFLKTTKFFFPTSEQQDDEQIIW